MRKRQETYRGRHAVIAGALGLLASLCIAAAAPAQQAGESIARDSTVVVGDRVRITTSSASEPVVGWVDDVASDDIRLVDEDDQEVADISREDIRRLERSRTRRSAWEQAAPGAIAGGIAGFIIGLATTEEQHCEPNSFLCFELPEKGLAAIGGFSIGMLGGGLISMALIPGESWEDASVPTLTAGADTDGGFVALRISAP